MIKTDRGVRISFPLCNIRTGRYVLSNDPVEIVNAEQVSCEILNQKSTCDIYILYGLWYRCLMLVHI